MSRRPRRRPRCRWRAKHPFRILRSWAESHSSMTSMHHLRWGPWLHARGEEQAPRIQLSHSPRSKRRLSWILWKVRHRLLLQGLRLLLPDLLRTNIVSSPRSNIWIRLSRELREIWRSIKIEGATKRNQKLGVWESQKRCCLKPVDVTSWRRSAV